MRMPIDGHERGVSMGAVTSGARVLGALVALALLIFGTIAAPSPFFGSTSADDGSHPAPQSDACASSAATVDFTCLRDHYLALVHDTGAPAAFAALKVDYQRNGYTRIACHHLVHEIGHATAEGAPDLNLPELYAQGDPMCAGGYYHGVASVVASRVGAEGLLADANAFCADLRRDAPRTFRHYSCAHGLGHGLMHLIDNDLPVALAGCDTVSVDWEREACYSGVFVENVDSMFNPTHPSAYLDPDEPLYPCHTMEERYKSQCYQHQAGYALFTRNNDYIGVFTLCAAVDDGFRWACEVGIGGSAAAHAAKFVLGAANQAATMGELCGLGPNDDAQVHCLSGAVSAVLRHYQDPAPAQAVCESVAANLRAGCSQAIAETSELLSG
jgi:hypothetical protein